MEQTTLDRSGTARKVYVRVVLIVPVLAAVFFIPAGTLAYWEAWLYLGVLLIPFAFVVSYFLRNNRAFLERRMQTREREPAQRRIIGLSFIWFALTFILPGLDRRFGWSDVPVPVVLAADLVVLLGYGLIVLVFRENQYAARIVRVEEGQRVITTGPYAIVRHPMYMGTLLMYLASPLALGSWWALLPALLIIPILVARIRNEEQVLERELPGYPEYSRRVHRRLFPGLW
jgi:protein-S-isoprenylcysteine O-methyltransferase Ste14